ncbi:MAG: vWA domain-containing protein [Acidobacteriaceae bacterium]|jgi:Flp pilus assembly protein TadG
MKINNDSFLARFFKDQSGQMLPIMALLVIVCMGIAALTVSAGNNFAVQSQLQNATNAAALAGAMALPQGASAATSAASNYASQTGDLNGSQYLKNATMVSGWPKVECLTTLTAQGIACEAPANANAVQVQQSITVPMFFGGLFGHSTITLTATATASGRGSIPQPYNIAVIIDATASMSDTDSDSQCSSSRFTCALNGIQSLVKILAPCSPLLSSCSTPPTAGPFGSNNVTDSVDRIALFSFPNVAENNSSSPTVYGAQYDYDCSSTNPTTEAYTFPTAGASTYTPLGSPVATYEIVGFSSDYRTSDTATSLNTSSNVSKALGAGGSTCKYPMSNPGGAGTYYAGAIYAAQSALVAEQAANPGSQNALILISDGDASSTNMGSAKSQATYPGTKQQCAQAVTAAQAAATAGTKVFSVSYGATSSGCSTDTSPAITPCQTMEGIASTPSYFFSDYTSSVSGVDKTCISASQPTSNLNQIFQYIGNDLTVARLIPNGTT